VRFSNIYKRKIIVLSILGIALCCMLVFLYHVEDERYLFPCIFYKLTGYQCPGCGTQRALHSLLHLNIKQAFLYNPMLFIAIPLIILLIYLEHFNGKNRFPKLHRTLSGKTFIMITLIFILIYWVGRNAIILPSPPPP